jgi:lipoprotein-releasing system permease protein
MNLEFFIANRIRLGGVTGKKLAGPVIKVATLGITLGMAVMILSVAIGLGFKKEIREKVIGFGAHIQVMSYDYNFSYEVNPIRDDDLLRNQLKALSGISKVQRFVSKPGIIKSKDGVHGLVLKGVGTDYDWSFFRKNLVAGEVLALNDDSVSTQILISRVVARMLNLKVGDPVPMFFLQQQVRARKFVVSGIYDSSLPEFDELFAVVDLRQVQKLNDWKPDQIAGYEILLSDFNQLDDITADIQLVTAGYNDPDGIMLRTRSIRQSQPQIFGWLDLLDTNIVVILVLITLVAGFNMISGLLILILERTNMIGILKALGANNWSLRKVFLYLSVYVIGRGLLWGNLVGITLCLVQQHFGIIQLDPENYYLDRVPVLLEPMHLLILNLGSILITTLMLIGPSYLVSHISPAKAIRFD